MARKSQPIIMNGFNQGGIADSDYIGSANSYSAMVGLDVHSEAGVMKVMQKLAKDSGTTVTEFVENIIQCSDGNTYFFSAESGKIWKRTSGGTYSLIHTTVPTSGEAKCLGAKEYDGFLYWATQNYIHRIDVLKTGTVDGSGYWTLEQENWAAMHLDQTPLGGIVTNISSAIPSSLTETSTLDHVYFTPRNASIVAVAIHIKDKGTGNWTVTMHNSANTVQGTAKTITNGSLVNDVDNMFVFASPIALNVGEEYHFHITSTVADGTVDSLYQDEIWSTACRIYAAGDDKFHPMEIQNLKLYIGDRYFIHQISNDVAGHIFSPSALDLPKPNRVKCLGLFGSSLLAGTWQGDSINTGLVFRWDTWSVSFNLYDDVPEVGINAFIKADNYVFVSAGNRGRIYSFDGVKLNLSKRVKGDYSGTNTDKVYPNATASIDGIPVIGYSNGSGNPHYEGLYSFGRTASNYPFILTLDYPISERDTVGEGESAYQELVLSGVEIGCVIPVGTNIFVSWRRTVGETVTYGIDKIDTSNKLNRAFFETRIIAYDRKNKKPFAEFSAGYKSLPTNTDLDFLAKVNHAASYTDLAAVKDTENQQIIARKLLMANTLKVKGLFTVSGNNAPEIEDIRFEHKIQK